MEQEDNQFSISFNNIKSIPFDKYEKNFTFIGNDKEYETSRFVADILAPIVREYHFIDESMNSISIDTSSNTRDYFQDFLKLVNFTQKTMNETERKCFIEYFIELGNIEEYLNLEGELLKEGDDDLNKIIDSLIHVNKILKQRTQIKETEQNLNIDRIISFLSLYFSKLSKEQVQKIPFEIIEEIMGNENLKIEDENSLLNLIICMYEEDDKYCELFEYVKYEHLREETLFKFIDIFNINHINNSIWKSICQRLISSTGEEERKGKRYKKNINEFKYEQGKEFNGILRYLSSESNGNN